MMMASPWPARKVAALGWGMYCVASGETDKEGTLSLKIPRTGVGYVMAYKSGVGLDYFTPLTVLNTRQFPLLPSEIPLKLNGVRPIKVKAIDGTEQPLADVHFLVRSFQKPNAPTQLFVSQCDWLMATTDKAGVATFDWLPKDMVGNIEFVSRSEERTTVDRMILNVAQQPELTVHMVPRARIFGHVYLPDGQAAGGIRVTATNTSGGPLPYPSTVTNLYGEYQIPTISEQTYSVQVSDERWSAPQRTDVVAHEGQPMAPVDFKLSAGTLIHGVVTQGEGDKEKPVANCRIDLTGTGDLAARQRMFVQDQINAAQRAAINPPVSLNAIRRSIQTDAKGRFEILTAPGTWSLQATAAGADEPQTAELKVTDQEEIKQNFKFPELKVVKLSGTILDATGAPLANALVVARQISGGASGRIQIRQVQTQTDKDGKYMMDREVVPTLLLVNNAQHEPVAVLNLDDDQTTADIRLKPLAEVKGRLIDEDGEPVTTGMVYSVSTLALKSQQINLRMAVASRPSSRKPMARSRSAVLFPAAITTLAFGPRRSATSRN